MCVCVQRVKQPAARHHVESSKVNTSRKSKRSLNTSKDEDARVRRASLFLGRYYKHDLLFSEAWQLLSPLTVNSFTGYSMQLPAETGRGGAGKGIKRLVWKVSGCGENQEIHFPLGSILVIKQRLLSYEALMNSLAK